MASRFFPLVLLLCGWPHLDCSFVKLSCNEKTVGQFGQPTLLMCVIKPLQTLDDINVFVVEWSHTNTNETVIKYESGKMTKAPGYELLEKSWDIKNLNVTLLITDTTVSHEGTYSVLVLTNRGSAAGTPTLSVTAKYEKPYIEKIKVKGVPKVKEALICKTEGGYPEGRLRWFDQDGYEWTRSATAKVDGKDGRFALSSEFPLEGSPVSQYTCAVFNASGGKEGQEIYQVLDPEDPGQMGSVKPKLTSTVIAPVVVIGSLIVGLLMALLWRRRQQQQSRRPSSAPLIAGLQQVPTRDGDVELGDPDAKNAL